MPSAELATVPDSIRQALRTLAGRLALVAAVSGRAAADARRLVGLDELVVVGNHGAERWERGALQQAPLGLGPHQVSQALREVAARLDPAGLHFENKGATGSIHYREAADPIAARAAILEALAAAPSRAGLVVEEGRLVVNLLPPAAPNKGTAVLALCTERHLAGAIYLGDDRTDLDAFAALREWRQQPGRRAASLAVLSAEEPPGLAELADATLAGVAEVESLLVALAATAAPTAT